MQYRQIPTKPAFTAVSMPGALALFGEGRGEKMEKNPGIRSWTATERVSAVTGSPKLPPLARNCPPGPLSNASPSIQIACLKTPQSPPTSEYPGHPNQPWCWYGTGMVPSITVLDYEAQKALASLESLMDPASSQNNPGLEKPCNCSRIAGDLTQ